MFEFDNKIPVSKVNPSLFRIKSFNFNESCMEFYQYVKNEKDLLTAVKLTNNIRSNLKLECRILIKIKHLRFFACYLTHLTKPPF